MQTVNAPFSAMLQTTLTTLAEQYKSAVAKEESLKKARKHLEEDLNEMGSDEKTIRGEKFRFAASSLTVTNRAIDQVRAEQEYLNDTIVELLVDAKQGKFWEDAELEGRMKRQDGPTMPLFDRAMALAGEAHPNIGEAEEDAKKRGKEAAKVEQAPRQIPPTPRPLSRGEDMGELGTIKVEDVIDAAAFPLVVESLHAHNVFTLADVAKGGKTFLVKNCNLDAKHAAALLDRVQQVRSMEPDKSEPAASGKPKGGRKPKAAAER